MQNGITFIILLLSLFVFLGVLLSYITHLFVSPSTETPRAVRSEIIDLLKIKSDEIVIDLGSGSGAFLIEIAKDTHAKCVGYDISPILSGYGRLKALFERIATKVRKKPAKIDISFEVGDFFRQDLNIADVLYLHQSARVLKHFEKKVVKQIENGQRVFCYETGFPKLKPHKTYKLSNNKILYEY
jgi:ubiquinone/menaquinone biosynthesis C-methylase UbiE